MKTRRNFSPEFKAKLVQQMLREEQRINQLAAEHGLHPNQLYRSREIALGGLTGLFCGQAAQEQAARQAAHQHEVHELYAHIGKLTTQLEWLEKKLTDATCAQQQRHPWTFLGEAVRAHWTGKPSPVLVSTPT